MSLLFINLLIGFDGLTLNLGPDITWQWFAALIWAISEGTIGMKSGASATFKIMNRYCTIAPPCASQISTIYSDAMFVLEKIIWRLKLSRPHTESTGVACPDEASMDHYKMAFVLPVYPYRGKKLCIFSKIKNYFLNVKCEPWTITWLHIRGWIMVGKLSFLKWNEQNNQGVRVLSVWVGDWFIFLRNQNPLHLK